jgi:hypothetical protein
VSRANILDEQWLHSWLKRSEFPAKFWSLVITSYSDMRAGVGHAYWLFFILTRSLNSLIDIHATRQQRPHCRCSSGWGVELPSLKAFFLFQNWREAMQVLLLLIGLKHLSMWSHLRSCSSLLKKNKGEIPRIVKKKHNIWPSVFGRLKLDHHIQLSIFESITFL